MYVVAPPRSNLQDPGIDWNQAGQQTAPSAGEFPRGAAQQWRDPTGSGQPSADREMRLPPMPPPSQNPGLQSLQPQNPGGVFGNPQTPEQRAEENEALRQMLVQRYMQQYQMDLQRQKQEGLQPVREATREEALSPQRQDRLRMFNNIQGDPALAEFASGRPLEEALATMTLVDLLKLGGMGVTGTAGVTRAMGAEGGENILQNAYKPLQKGETTPMSHLETGKPGWSQSYNPKAEYYRTPKAGTVSREYTRPNIITDTNTRGGKEAMDRFGARYAGEKKAAEVSKKYKKPDAKKVWSDAKDTAKKNRQARKKK